MNILILHDSVPEPAPADQLDTMIQVAEIGRYLVDLGHRVGTLALADDLADTARELVDRRPEIIFNLVETVWGRGRLIHLVPELLDVLGVAYTGSPAQAIKQTSNKLTAKAIMAHRDLPTAPWLTLDSPPQPAPGPAIGTNRYIIKSVWEHASIGLEAEAVVTGADRESLFLEMARRGPALGGECFAEEFIDGREFNLAVLTGPAGPQVLPPAEIIFEGYDPEAIKVVGYRAKWDSDSFEYHHTRRRFDFPVADQPLLDNLTALSLACWRIFGLAGWARVDFRVDRNGQPWILEVNINPCLSADAGFMAAAYQAGLRPSAVVARILAATTRPQPNGRPSS